MDHFKFCFLQYSNTEVISIITHISSKPSTDMTSAGIYGKFRPYNTTLLEPAPHPPHRRANEGVRFPITNGSLFANQNSRNQPPGKNFNVHNKGEILGRRGFRAEIEKSNWNPASNDFMEWGYSSFTIYVFSHSSGIEILWQPLRSILVLREAHVQIFLLFDSYHNSSLGSSSDFPSSNFHISMSHFLPEIFLITSGPNKISSNFKLLGIAYNG